MSNSENITIYPPYRVVHGDEGYLGAPLVVPNPRWSEIQSIVLAGYERANDSIIDATIDNMASVGYEQLLQNMCKDNNIDTCLAMAIIAVVSEGDPSVKEGLFGVGGIDVTNQIELGLKKLVTLREEYQKGNNLMGWIQSFARWDSNMDIANKKTATFDKDWVGTMKYCGFSRNDMSFFPAVMKAYEVIPTKRTATSQITSSGIDGVEFPFNTSQLNNVFFIKQYGITNYGGGVVTATDCMVLAVSSPEPVYSPVQGSVTTVNGETRVVSSKTGYQYVFIGLTDTFSDGGEGVLAGQKIGQCNDKLLVKCYDANGVSMDPYVSWGLLQGKLSEDMSKSIGKFLEEESMRY